MDIIKDFTTAQKQKILNLRVYEDKKTTIRDIVSQSDDVKEDYVTYKTLNPNILEDDINFLWAYRIYLAVKRALKAHHIDEPVRYEDLGYLVGLAIVTNYYIDPDEHNITLMQDILLSAEDIDKEVKEHPDFIKGCELVNKSPIWKDLMAEAEWDIVSKYAYQIYLQIEESF